MKNCIKSDFKDICLKLATNEWSDKTFLLTSKLRPLELYVPALGLYTYIKSWKIIENQTSKRYFWNLQQMTKVTRCSYWHQNFVAKELSAPALGLYTCKIMKKRCIKSDFKEIFLKLVVNDPSDKRFLLTSKFCLLGCLPDLWLHTFIKSWKDVYKVRGWRDSF